MVGERAALSREELFELLQRRIDDPSTAAAIEREVWERCGADRAIFVSDLSGFTRLTHKHGILHFLTVYKRSTSIAAPLLDQNGGRCVKREADNLIYSFESVRGAVLAARAFVDASRALDRSLPLDERIHPCIGIGFGRVLELSDDVFGDEVNIAFKLGEDVARRREILVSDSALAQLRLEGEDIAVEERNDEIGGVAVRYHALVAPHQSG